MGYRERLGKINKKEALRYFGKTEEQIKNEFGEKLASGDVEFSFYDPNGHEEIFCIGHLGAKPPGKKSFYSFDLDGYEFSILSKEDFIFIIKTIHKTIVDDFNYIKNNNGFEGYFYRRQQEWDNKFSLNPYNTNEKIKRIVDSGFWEYEIFELVRLFKTFDWENDLLIFSGW